MKKCSLTNFYSFSNSVRTTKLNLTFKNPIILACTSDNVGSYNICKNIQICGLSQILNSHLQYFDLHYFLCMIAKTAETWHNRERTAKSTEKACYDRSSSSIPHIFLCNNINVQKWNFFHMCRNFSSVFLMVMFEYVYLCKCRRTDTKTFMNNIAHAGAIYCAIYVTMDCFLGLHF